MNKDLNTSSKFYNGEKINKDKLRQLVQHCIRNKQYHQARFYAQKVSTLTSSPDDIYILADILYHCEEYIQTINVLRKGKLLFFEHNTLNTNHDTTLINQNNFSHTSIHNIETEKHMNIDESEKKSFNKSTFLTNIHTVISRLRVLHLAALCATKLNNQTECVSFLIQAANHPYQIVFHLLTFSLNEENKQECYSIFLENEEFRTLLSSICVLRGKAHHMLDDTNSTLNQFIQALKIDFRNIEAFDYLFQNFLLSTEEEQNLIDSLSFDSIDSDSNKEAQFGWLKLFYLCQIRKNQINEIKSSELIQKISNELLLSEDFDFLALRASISYQQNDFRTAFKIANKILTTDSQNSFILTIYICSMYELNFGPKLFAFAEKICNERPKSAISQFACGVYNLLIEKWENARQHFRTSINFDSNFGPAQLGFGHGFAYAGEFDQAMAAYRSAHRVMKGSHLPLLCIGIEYMRTNNIRHSLNFFIEAKNMCNCDPLVYNELGVAYYRLDDYKNAIKQFEYALTILKTSNNKTNFSSIEPVLYNLGHCYRHLGKYDKAIKIYRDCLSNGSNNQFSVYMALGLTSYLMLNFDKAVDYYHDALSLNPRHILTHDLLEMAMNRIVTYSIKNNNVDIL